MSLSQSLDLSVDLNLHKLPRVLIAADPPNIVIVLAGRSTEVLRIHAPRLSRIITERSNGNPIHVRHLKRLLRVLKDLAEGKKVVLGAVEAAPRVFKPIVVEPVDGVAEDVARVRRVLAEFYWKYLEEAPCILELREPPPTRDTFVGDGVYVSSSRRWFFFRKLNDNTIALRLSKRCINAENLTKFIDAVAQRLSGDENEKLRTLFRVLDELLKSVVRSRGGDPELVESIKKLFLIVAS